MARDSKIEWCMDTWNPTVGCSIVSPGCTNCYAMRMAARLEAMGQPIYAGMTQPSKAGPVWTGKVELSNWGQVIRPLSWKRPRRIFVNSMSDLFHESLSDEAIDKVFAVMALCPQHTFQVLTKRAERMRAYSSDPQTPFRVARAIDELSARHDLGLEEILPIAGYPGYFASSHGFIYSERRGKRRRMSPDIGDQGHQRVQLYRGTSPKIADRLLVHRLILETFIGPPPAPDVQGRHLDGVPTNCALSNLSWGDQGANWADSRRHGTHRRHSKLTEEQAAAIRRRHAAGETGEALAREYDVSATQIRNIASGKQWAVAAPIEWPLSNVWKGISCERQQEADERIPLLLQTPAAVRFVSAEPLLGWIDLTRCGSHYTDSGPLHLWRAGGDGQWRKQFMEPPPEIDWVIVGGESGPKARPMHPDWARSLRDQCRAAGVAFFFKQRGEYTWIDNASYDDDRIPELPENWRERTDRKHICMRADGSTAGGYGGDSAEFLHRVGKKAAGRLLDGRTHDEFPSAPALLSQHQPGGRKSSCSGQTFKGEGGRGVSSSEDAT